MIKLESSQMTMKSCDLDFTHTQAVLLCTVHRGVQSIPAYLSMSIA